MHADTEMEHRLTTLENGLAAEKERITNLHRDIHSPESFSLSSQVKSIKEEVARYKNLIIGGVAVVIFLSGYNAINIGKLVANLKP